MSDLRTIRACMEEIRAAMADHQRVWREVKAAQARLTGRGSRGQGNREAYGAARPHWERMARAWERLARELPEGGLDEAPGSVDLWIEVCEMDIPAFRLGYLKEQFWGMPLDDRDRYKVALALRRVLHHRPDLAAGASLTAAEVGARIGELRRRHGGLRQAEMS